MTATAVAVASGPWPPVATGPHRDEDLAIAAALLAARGSRAVAGSGGSLGAGSRRREIFR